MSLPQSLVQGTRIGGHYIVGPLINRGEFGAIYRGVDTSEGNHPCAIKETYDVTPAARRQALMEASILFTVKSKHLPAVYDAFEAGGRFYLVMQLIEGQNLLQLLRNRVPGGVVGEQEPHRQSRGPCSEQEVLSWLLPIMDVLQELHSRHPAIIHRDIKPANIILTPQQTAVLVNFGLTKLYDPDQNTQTIVRAVSEGFSPLEQYLWKTGPQSDIYSMAATMYLLLTDRLPPAAMTRAVQDTLIAPRLLNSALSPQVERALLKALALYADDRYQSISEFAQALQAPTSVKTVRQVHTTSGNNLHVSLGINAEEAEHGTTRTITIPGGRILNVTIPPKVSNGQLIVLTEEGESDPRGNVRLTVTVKQEKVERIFDGYYPPVPSVTPYVPSVPLDDFELDDFELASPSAVESPSLSERERYRSYATAKDEPILPPEPPPPLSRMVSRPDLMTFFRRIRWYVSKRRMQRRDHALPSSTTGRHGMPAFSILYQMAVDQLRSLIRRESSKKPLSLFTIARAELEKDDRALVGKTYLIEAGIAPNRPEHFIGEPFILPDQKRTESLWFDIVVHSSDNIDLGETWHQRLHYDPHTADPQQVTFSFRFTEAGRGTLMINFYHQQCWLKTIRFEIETIEQTASSVAAISE